MFLVAFWHPHGRHEHSFTPRQIQSLGDHRLRDPVPVCRESPYSGEKIARAIAYRPEERVKGVGEERLLELANLTYRRTISSPS